jgi:hypothetical protein
MLQPGIFCRRGAESCRPAPPGGTRVFSKLLKYNDILSGTGLAKDIALLRPVCA